MKIKIKYAEVTCCQYCLQELVSRGEKVYHGGFVGEGECELCHEMDELQACLVDVE